MIQLTNVFRLTAPLLLCGCAMAGKLSDNAVNTQSKHPPEYPTYGCTCDNSVNDSIYDCKQIPYTPVAAVVSEPTVLESKSKCEDVDDHTADLACEHRDALTFTHIRLLRNSEPVSDQSRFLVNYRQNTIAGVQRERRGLVLKKNIEYVIFVRRRVDSLLPRTEFQIAAACEKAQMLGDIE